MSILLAGDVGATKTLLRLVDTARGHEVAEHGYASPAFPHLVPLVQDFLARAAQRQGGPVPPAAACFGIAGPVVANTCQLTNLRWALDGERLARELAIPRVELINDFAAVGHGVLGLAPEDLCTLQAGQPEAAAPMAVIGAGTGLGEGFLIPHGGGHRVFGSEGGHVDFAPRSAEELALLRHLQEVQRLPRVSVERVVSGPGIAAIYQFLRHRDPAPASVHAPAELERVFRVWQQEQGQEPRTADLAAAVAQAAAGGQDALSAQAMALFFAAYGAAVGNLALKLLPYGGLYVAGGIAAKNMALLRSSGFLDAFRDKGRMRPVVERVPLHVVRNPRVGLLGAQRRAAELAAG